MSFLYDPRIKLAEQYLKYIDTGLSSYFLIAAPEGKGKTRFIKNDFSPLAASKSFLPLYVCLRQHASDPQLGLTNTLKSAISHIEENRPIITYVQTEPVARLVSGSDAPNSEDLIQLDRLLAKLEKKSRDRVVILILDDVEYLATSKRFDALTAALRAMLDKRQGRVKCIFLGSSRHHLGLFFNDSNAPFYQFVDELGFPDPKEVYI